MKLLHIFILTLAFQLYFCTLKAQDTTAINTFNFNQLKPIVQIFGTADYDTENNRYDYHFGRAHLGLQYQYNDKWSAKIIIDRGRATSVGEISVIDSTGGTLDIQNTAQEGAYYTMFLKFASLQWKVNERLSLEAGAILQNHYITQERFWGFRYVAQTFQDLYWKIPSSDLGFIAFYKINKTISLDASITNGEGVRAQQDAAGKIKLAGGLNIKPTAMIESRIYYHNRQASDEILYTEQMYAAFIGLKPTPKLRIGSEFNYMKHLNYSVMNSYGYSIYSSYAYTDKTSYFVRFDRLLNDTKHTDNTNTQGDGYSIMTGFSHTPVKKVNISLNYQGWLSDHHTAQNHILLSMEYKF